MANSKKTVYDVASELIIVPWQGGIQLCKPSSNSLPALNSSKLTVNDALKFPFNVFFLDRQSIICQINEETIRTCAYPSVKETVGKTIELAAKTQTVNFSINHDKSVISSRALQIKEEYFLRRDDDMNFHAVTLKFPCYDKSSQLIGVFGCSIIIGDHAIADALLLLVKSGLMSNTTSRPSLPGCQLENTQLSHREMQCLQLLVQGKSAKMIAYTLKLSTRTVEHYLENIKMKLNVYSKNELIEVAIKNGFNYK